MPYLSVDLRAWSILAIKLHRPDGPESPCIAVVAGDYNNTFALSISRYAITSGSITKNEIAGLLGQEGWKDLNSGPHLGLGGEQGYLIGKEGFDSYEPALKVLLQVLGPRFKFYRG